VLLMKVSVPNLPVAVDVRYAAFAFFLDFCAVFDGDFDSVFRFAAHRWRILSAAASRWAALNFRRLLFTAGTGEETAASISAGLFGGLPRRFVGP